MSAAHRLLILSNPAPGKEEEFHAWYPERLAQFLTIPGFDAVQQFELSDDQFPPEAIPPSEHQYMTVYEVSSSPEEAIERLMDVGMATVPDVIDAASRRAFWFSAVGPLHGAVVPSPEHKLIVLANPISEALDGNLNAWYDEHLEELIGMGAGVVNAQRFKVSDAQFPAEVSPPCGHRYLALYDTDTAPKHTCDTLAGAMADYEHPDGLDMATLRDWMFTALEARRVAQ
ncbi:unannotated protein [freshwater metagenome]|uniref:Unannotated protein n=1 Tax=freshwater metagenome TaxID=449393 RepID=A0A6J7HAP7_9ZZZZ|nr:hypothetical protein [Actinomycetota bacterium]